MNAPSTNRTLIAESIEDNITTLKTWFQNCSDVVFREIIIGVDQEWRAQIIWIDGFADITAINVTIMQSLLHEARALEPDEIRNMPQAYRFIKERLLSSASIKEVDCLEELTEAVFNGKTAILFDGITVCLTVGTKGGEVRAVSEPVTESVVRGPRQGFTENIQTNTSLIRRIIKTPDLKMETMKVGRRTQTDVIVAYLNGVARDEVVQEVLRRIKRIDIDSILESAYIEESIEDHPESPFPTIAHTERPDKAAADLLEGRVAIFVDGTPFVLLAPAIFIQFIHASEDYYERYLMAFSVRLIRVLFFLIALVFPAAYIAITTYHQEMLPTSLLVSVASSREGVPFPAIIEALLMEITFEALREAGVRLPRPVGQAISIVGALVIGEAAVQAGIVSSPMVIVVAITAIASFVIPAFNVAVSVRMLRFPLMFLAGVLGLYGVMLGLLVLLIHLCSLASFGTPYFTPMAPFNWGGMRDAILRQPWRYMKNRPSFVSGRDKKRQQMPEEPS
ncbi:MAG: spore gernimation protein [Paenibacillus sp.]|nr:spore gernimation protein [Paenibacillus sp.]